MNYISTRKGLSATSAETIFRGLAPDGGLYVPDIGSTRLPRWIEPTLRNCAETVAETLFGDIPADVRHEAVDRLVARFPAEDPIPLVERGGFRMLELFHGRTGAFKDVALSMLPVLMRHAAGGRRVLVLTATSGDTGSAAMQGFAGVDGTEIVVFYPAAGTSRIQRLQMTTPADANVHAVGIRGNFDDAQAAVKRIFADRAIADEAAARGVTLSSANSINTGRLVPQVAYYVLAVQRLTLEFGAPYLRTSGIDVVVPSGNFGNILAAYYAKLLGAPIGRLVVASNVNDVLARFVRTGIYDPGPDFAVTNSPSMDIRISSNVERLLWILNDGDCGEVSRLMDDLARTGRYELRDAAKGRLASDFDGGVATPEETEAEMRRMRADCGCLIDPHTAVATCVARKLGYPRGRAPCVVAATATPYKFPETCLRAFGEDVLADPPQCIRELDGLPVAQTAVVDVCDIPGAVRALL
ncbi:MAG: threonine synthase [Kiritimatiellae bacterium]|nr:threonine synthase [Kiritimatiellia bacterium]